MKTDSPLSSITNGSTTSTSVFKYYNDPVFIEAIENIDSIELLYKETSRVTYTDYGANNQVRVFKIVFSCIDGKWNKSERIYGEINAAQGEYYTFD